MLTKRGLSPLLATILLIFFAVALGALVMNLGSHYETEIGDYAINASEICSEARFEIFKRDDIQSICIDKEKNEIQFIGINRGTVPIVGLQMWLVSDTLKMENIPVKEISPQMTIDETVSIDNTGDLQKIEFIVKVNHPEASVPYLCADFPSAVITEIKDC